MKWINSKSLQNVNQELSAACALGNSIYGKMECFQFPPADFASKSPGRCSRGNPARSTWLRSSGPSLLQQQKIPTPEHFNAVKSAIEMTFPDYEFSNVIPEHFEVISTLDQARSTISWHLMSYLPSVEALSMHIWSAIECEVSPALCDIYSYEPTCSDVFTENGALWSKIILFVNDKSRKVLLFHLREGAQGFEDESDDEANSYSDDIMESRFGFGVF